MSTVPRAFAAQRFRHAATGLLPKVLSHPEVPALSASGVFAQEETSVVQLLLVQVRSKCQVLDAFSRKGPASMWVLREGLRLSEIHTSRGRIKHEGSLSSQAFTYLHSV